MTTHYITTEVGIDLEDFHDDDLIEELQYRGYTIIKGADEWGNDAAYELYQSFILDSDEQFKKTLKNFFKGQLNKCVL